jgi:outer membrane protein assembly factor BamB
LLLFFRKEGLAFRTRRRRAHFLDGVSRIWHKFELGEADVGGGMCVAKGMWGTLGVLAAIAASGNAHAANWPTFAGSAQRLGYNGLETTLTPAAVAGGLKLHWSADLTGGSATQALFVENAATAHGTHNEVFQTTLQGRVVALNAATGKQDWSVQLPTGAPSCAPKIPPGIHGTPTIDTTAGLLYVVDDTGLVHALAIGTGTESPGYPQPVIAAADLANGNYNHSSPTLVGSTLYITTSVVPQCEYKTPYHGSVIAFGTSTKAVAATFYPVTAAVGGAGIWGPGGAAADASTGDLFVATGNALTKPAYQGLAESVVALDPNLNVLASHSPGPPVLTASGDFDFGSTPTPIDSPNCAPLMSVMNKTGYLYLYPRDTLAAGPVQVLSMGTGISRGAVKSAFHGMAAYDPVLQMLFIDNPISAAGGAFTHGAVAMILNSASCTLEVAWLSTFGSNAYSSQTVATDPVIAGGVVWMVTGIVLLIYLVWALVRPEDF